QRQPAELAHLGQVGQALALDATIAEEEFLQVDQPGQVFERLVIHLRLVQVELLQLRQPAQVDEPGTERGTTEVDVVRQVQLFQFGELFEPGGAGDGQPGNAQRAELLQSGQVGQPAGLDPDIDG